jgi:ribosomal protein S18 acetylase RimI-like enzyme
MEVTQFKMVKRSIRVRPARRADAPAIARLAGELARHVEDPDPRLTPERVIALGFGSCAMTRYLVATVDGAVAGMAAFGTHVDLHMNLPTVYLSDLAVDPAAQGTGAGRALMAALARLALARGAVLRWGIWQENAQALAFYQACGAVRLDEDVFAMGLEGAALEAMAAG